MGIIEIETYGDTKRETEVAEGYKNRASLSLEERFRLMYRQDAFGKLSPELDIVSKSGSLSLFMGMFF